MKSRYAPVSRETAGANIERVLGLPIFARMVFCSVVMRALVLGARVIDVLDRENTVIEQIGIETCNRCEFP
jgi:hypothetical protein